MALSLGYLSRLVSSVEQWSFDLDTLKMRVAALPVSLGYLSRLVLSVEQWSCHLDTLKTRVAAIPVSLGYRLDLF